MARLRHATLVRTEHAAIGVGAVLVVGAATLIPISAGAHDTTVKTETAVALPKTTDELPAELQELEPASTVAAQLGQPSGKVAGAAISAPEKKPWFDPSITPTGWFTPVATYYFSARFGEPGSWQSGYHTGLDFVADEFSRIRTPTDAVVVSADEEGAYGNLIKLQIAPKTQIWMAHMNEFSVAKGDHLKAGTTVGFVGVTGNTTGPHVHFEVRVNDKPVDPVPYFWPDGKGRELR